MTTSPINNHNSFINQAAPIRDLICSFLVKDRPYTRLHLLCKTFHENKDVRSKAENECAELIVDSLDSEVISAIGIKKIKSLPLFSHPQGINGKALYGIMQNCGKSMALIMLPSKTIGLALHYLDQSPRRKRTFSPIVIFLSKTLNLLGQFEEEVESSCCFSRKTHLVFQEYCQNVRFISHLTPLAQSFRNYSLDPSKESFGAILIGRLPHASAYLLPQDDDEVNDLQLLK